MRYTLNIAGLITCFTILASTQIFGTTLHLSLTEAIEIALHQNEDMKIAQINEDQAEKEYQIIRSQMLPHISAQGIASKYFDRSVVPKTVPGPGGVAVFHDMPINRKYGLETQLIATQVLFSFGQIFNSVQAANQGIEIKKIQKENDRQDIILNTTNTYLALLLSEKALKIAKESHENATTIKSILSGRYSKGRSPLADLVKLDRDIAFRWTEVLKAKNENEMAEAYLKYYLNVGQDTHLVLKTDLSMISLTNIDLYEKRLQNNSNIKLLKNKITADDYLIKSKKAAFLPTLSSFVAYNHTGSSEKNDFSDVPGINHVGTVGIRINIPLFEGGKTSSAYKNAVLEKTKTMISLEKAKRLLVLDLEKSLIEFQSHRAIYKQNLQSIELAKKTFEISKKRFASGQSSITELNDAELLLTQAKINKEMTLFKINQLNAKINRLTR